MSQKFEQLSLFNDNNLKNLNSVLIFELSKDVLKKLDNYNMLKMLKQMV